MTDEVAEGTIKWLSSQKLKRRKSHITFFGGEPLLRPEFIKNFIRLGNEINRRPDIYSILTNGTVWNKEVSDCLKFMKRNSTQSIMQISLDGGEKSHNKFRIYPDGRGSFGDIIENIEKFKEIYPDLILRQTVVPENVENLFDDFRMMHDLCGEGGSVSLTSIVEGDWNQRSIGIYKEEIARILSYYKSTPQKGTFNLLHGTLKRMVSQETKKSRGCAASKTLCCVDIKGDIYPCHRFASYQNYFDYKIGDIYGGVDQGSEVYKKVIKVFGFSEKCNKCRITNCNVCMATNMFLGKGLNMEPPAGYCEMGFSVNDMLEDAVLENVSNGKIGLDWGNLLADKNGGGYFKMNEENSTKFEDSSDLTAQAMVAILKMLKEMMVEIGNIKKEIYKKKEPVCECDECSSG